MNASVLEQAKAAKLCRTHLAALAKNLPSDDSELDILLRQWIAGREAEAFTRVVLAALQAKRAVQADLLVEGACLMDDFGSLAAASFHMTGNVALALVKAVEAGRMGWEREVFALLLAGISSRDKGCAAPTGLSTQARQFARRNQDFLTLHHLRELAVVTNDLPLHSILDEKAVHRFEGLPHTAGLLTAMHVPGPLEHLPERPPPTALSGYTVRRSVERVGRNDPCPCGSGKKYKRCCLAKDESRLVDSSDVPGLTREELREHMEEHLTRQRLEQMRSYQVARLDSAKVPSELLYPLISRLLLFEEYEAVIRVFQVSGFSGQDVVDGWVEAIDLAASRGRKDVVERLMALRSPQDLRPDEVGLTAQLVLAKGAHEILALIENIALAGLNEDTTAKLVELAYSLLDHSPALGILVTRSVVPIADPFDSMALMETLLETRDKLALAPDDPFDDIMEQRWNNDNEHSTRQVDDENLEKVRFDLKQKSQEMNQLRNKLAAVEQELERKAKIGHQQAQSQNKAPEGAAQESPELSTLRERFKTTRTELRERHAERNQLRRELENTRASLEELQLQKTADRTDGSAIESSPEEQEDRLLLEEEPLAVQPVRLPEFPKRFHDALAPLPRPVARSAIATIGRLAGGAPEAFVGVKRLKLRPDIYRQRVGATYRLLFRLHAETLEVVALIHRRDLERKIRTL